MNKERQIEKNLESIFNQFKSEVVKSFDAKLKGNYFKYDASANEDKKGISYSVGGKRLLEKGAKLISQALVVYGQYLNETSRAIKKIEDMYKNAEITPGVESHAIKSCLRDAIIEEWHSFKEDVQTISEKLHNREKPDLYELNRLKRAYVAANKLSRFDRYSNQAQNCWGLGEMLFHQIRMHGMAQQSSYSVRELEKIKDTLHVGFFDDTLGKGKRKAFGETLAEEILTTDFNFEEKYPAKTLPAMQALAAIDRYRVTTPALIKKATTALIAQATYYSKSLQHKIAGERLKESYEKTMKQRDD